MFFHYDLLEDAVVEFETQWLEWQEDGEIKGTEPYLEEFVRNALKKHLNLKDANYIAKLAEIYLAYIVGGELKFCEQMETLVHHPIDKATFAIGKIAWNHFENVIEGYSFLDSTFPSILKIINDLLWGNKIEELDEIVIGIDYKLLKKDIEKIMSQYKIREFISSCTDMEQFRTIS